MPTSLLHVLLTNSRNFTDDDYQRLPVVTKRLMTAELYEALNRDPEIMPLLVETIAQHNNAQGSALLELLFKKLADRIGVDYDRIIQP